MRFEDYIRVLDLLEQQAKTDGCEGRAFIKTNER